jgi:hypothetical protein
MRDYKSLAHSRWDCKYHVVFIPKRRRKLIFGPIRKHLGEIFHDLAKRKGVVIEERHLISLRFYWRSFNLKFSDDYYPDTGGYWYRH